MKELLKAKFLFTNTRTEERYSFFFKFYTSSTKFIPHRSKKICMYSSSRLSLSLFLSLLNICLHAFVPMLLLLLLLFA